MKGKARKPLFERLQAGLKEAIAHNQGVATLKTIERPANPPEIDAETIVALRESAQMSQVEFANLFFVSPKTLESWERGRTAPSNASRRLIHIFTEETDMVCKVIGIPRINLQGFHVETSKNGTRRIVKS